MANRSATARCSGSEIARRTHCATIANRMITYPTVMIAHWPSTIASCTPAARTRTPAIWTIVVRRYSQSSVSKAEANQVKFIHAHQIAKKIIA